MANERGNSGTLALFPWWCEQRQSDTGLHDYSADY